MTKKDDGGAAFLGKIVRCDDPAGHGRVVVDHQGFPGTLLDYFAGQALAGARARPIENATPPSVAKWAYDDAEAMIAEKRRREG